MLLDEPTSGLDPKSAHDVRRLVLRLRDERRAVLLSTHNLDEVDRLADRVALLRTRLVAMDTPAALRAQLFGARVRIVVGGDAGLHVAALRASGVHDVVVNGSTLSITLNGRVTVPALVRHLVEDGADISSVMPEERSLEDVYLRLLGDSR